MSKEEVYNKIENHYRDNYERLTSIATKFLHSTERSEDVVQEAYTRALTYWESVPEVDSEFAPWFQTIFNNCVKENWTEERGRGVSMSDGSIPEIPVKAAGIPSIILKAVQKRIEGRDEGVSKILNLYFIDGYNAREIAEMVPETANAIRVIVHRFREEIKKDYRWVI